MGKHAVKHNVDPRFVPKSLNASTQFGGAFEFMFQAYVGHEDFILNSFHSLSENKYRVRWDMHVAQTNELTGISYVAHQTYYQQEYPEDLVRTAFEDEFPHLNPLQTDMALFAIRDSAHAADKFVKAVFQRWYNEGPPVLTHDNSAHRLPLWTRETLDELQAKLDCDAGIDLMAQAR